MMDEPLDFEKEDEILATPHRAGKRRRIIGLDDLLSDFYTEKSKLVQSGSKKPSKSKGYNLGKEDDETHNTERIVSNIVANCRKQVDGMKSEDDIPWGLKFFGNQKSPPSLHLTGLGKCKLLQSLTKNELNSSFYLNDEQGESFLEGLLRNGWLSKLAIICDDVDDSIASWTFYTMLYSSNEKLQDSACEFWRDILLPKDKADRFSVRLSWLPSYSQLKEALEIYGYLPDTSKNSASISEPVHEGNECEGPPQNIRSWVKVLSACCQIRKTRSIFSTSEVEDFFVVLIHLLLDRQLQGLSFALEECMNSVINFFGEREWEASCKKIAHSVAYRIPRDLNCLQTVECISGLSARGRQLRSQLALEILTICFDQRDSDGKEILELLMTTNVKDKDCDFFKLYICLVLAENMLLCHHLVEERVATLNKWCKYLRNCSTQIPSGDWRPYATKVRNKASYLLQNSIQRRNYE